MARLKRLDLEAASPTPSALPADVTAPVRTAAIYCRISKDTEDRKAGVDRQEIDCRRIAAQHGYVVPDEFVFIDNNKSAWRRNVKRPGWDAMLGAVATSRFDAIIVWNADRLMRQPRDLEKLLDIAEHTAARGRPVQLYSDDKVNARDFSSASDRADLRIEVAQAVKSSDDTSRRTKRALEDYARTGKPHGSARPFGYEKGGMVIREDEAVVVREIVRRVLRGESLNAIVTDLNARGVLTSSGKRFWPNTLRVLLTNSRIAGLRAHRSEHKDGAVVAVAQWPGIVSVDDWTRMQDVLEQRNMVWNREETPRNFYMLRGILRCSGCGTKLTGEKRGVGRVYRCKKSSATDACGGRTLMAEDSEKWLVDAAVAALTKLDLSVIDTEQMDQSLQEALAADEKMLDMLREEWTAKRLDSDKYERARREIWDRMDRTREMATGSTVRHLRQLTGPKFPEKWAAMTNAERNQVLRAVFKDVRVKPRILDRAQGYFDSRRLDITWAI